MPTDNTPTPGNWYLYAGTGAHRFMVELHERGVPAEEASEMMRNFGRRFVEESDHPAPEVADRASTPLTGDRRDSDLGGTPRPGSRLDRFIKASSDAERDAILREAFPPAARNGTAD